MWNEETALFEELINKKADNGDIIKVKKPETMAHEPIIFEDCFIKKDGP